MKIAALFCAVFFFVGWAPPCIASDDGQRLKRVKKLYSEQKWEEAAREAQGPAAQSPELDYYAGMALARLERWNEAEQVFSAGARKSPTDARFLTERAGAEYKLNDFRAAKKDLQGALRLAPDDWYIPEFLGTIYLLEGNLEAALKYWNRLEKPRLTAVEIAPPARTENILLDRAVLFAPPQTLQRDTLLKTDALLENLGVFPRWRTELTPNGDDGYKATLKLTERSGWGANAIDGAISLLRGLPYETVYPSWTGIDGGAVNFDSLVRWDSEKRRIAANLEFPLFQQPARRVRVFFDQRNENWNLSNSLFGGTTAVSDLNLRRFSGGAELHAVESGWWDWTAGVQAVSREFRNMPSDLPSSATPFFTGGRSLDAHLRIHRCLLRIPERRFAVEGTGEVRGGRNYAAGLGAFGSVKGDVSARWLPKARSEDLEFVSQLRGGDTFGDVPLDLLYELGVERDNDLWMRGHDGTTDGRKGNAPLGRRYILWNSELNKNVYDSGYFRVQVGPFFDTGAIADPSGLFGSQKWLYDTGVQAKVRILGSVSVVLSYGRDLRNGKGLFYVHTAR
ncbi:MAG TPA: tetratricopeptide repeat protein [Candidatus Acidoferrum sp.]|nr:tetratricopeptide repeat protein [Candidatus Acidoferrum sp.]